MSAPSPVVAQPLGAPNVGRLMAAGGDRDRVRGIGLGLVAWLLLACALAPAAGAETLAVRENLRARERPAADAPTTGRLPARTALQVLKRTDGSDGAPWVKLTFRKTTGWVPVERTKSPPMPGCRSRAMGTASNGSLVCGKLLPASTELWYSYNPITGEYPNAAERRWGTDTMLAVIEEVSLAYWRKFPKAPRIVIGDISRKHGGHFDDHHSHQQGIDADVYYPRHGGGPARAPHSHAEIDRGRSQWLVERFAAERTQVVYVGAGTGLRRSRSNIQYLSAGHETHFHVRLLR